MINLEFLNIDGDRVGMEYDVHPRSQEEQPIRLPDDAVYVRVWLGVR